MTISRRIFIRNGAVATALSGVMFKTAHGATGVPASGAAAGAPATSAGRARAALFTRESFARHLNTQFMVKDKNSKGVRMTLAAIQDRNPMGDNHAATKQPGECFSLHFRTNPGAPLLQDTYHFDHPALGQFALFIVPSPGAGRGVGYEAVINRLS